MKLVQESYNDLQALVSDQGQEITYIETRTAEAKESVQAGTGHLEVAEKHQVAARKKQCLILCCCVVLLGLIFGILGGFGIFKKK